MFIFFRYNLTLKFYKRYYFCIVRDCPCTRLFFLLINLRYKAVNDSRVQLFEWYWLVCARMGNWIKAQIEYLIKKPSFAHV